MPADCLRPRPLGASGMDVSALSLGSWRTFEHVGKQTGTAIMAAARDEGINFFDDARYSAGYKSARQPAVPDLVSVGVGVGDLGDTVSVALPVRRLQSPLSYLGHQGVEVVDDDGVHGVAGVFRPLDDVHQPVFGEF